MARMSPRDRRDAIVDAALVVARRKGLAGTTVRDVATRDGHVQRPDPPLLRDDGRRARGRVRARCGRGARADRGVLAAGRRSPLGAHARSSTPTPRSARTGRSSSGSMPGPRPRRRPALREASESPQPRLGRAARAGDPRRRRDGAFRCADPTGAAWRILSIVDGLALQVVAHRTIVDRADMLEWAATAAERELGLAPGALAVSS